MNQCLLVNDKFPPKLSVNMASCLTVNLTEEELLERDSYHEALAGKFYDKEPIHILEARVALMCIRRLGRAVGNRDKRHLILTLPCPIRLILQLCCQS